MVKISQIWFTKSSVVIKISTKKWVYSCMKFIVINVLDVKVKWTLYRPGVAQRVGRYIALLFHDRGTRRGWVVSSTPWPYFTPGKDSVPILQEAGWAPVPVWTGGKSRPHRDSIPDRLARSQSLYWLSYPAQSFHCIHGKFVCAAASKEMLIQAVFREACPWAMFSVS